MFHIQMNNNRLRMQPQRFNWHRLIVIWLSLLVLVSLTNYDNCCYCCCEAVQLKEKVDSQTQQQPKQQQQKQQQQKQQQQKQQQQKQQQQKQQKQPGTTTTTMNDDSTSYKSSSSSSSLNKNQNNNNNNNNNPTTKSNQKQTSSSNQQQKQPQQPQSIPQIKDLSPIILTSRNFGSSISDGNVWLIEAYAPWCSHCVSFAHIYNDIAAHFHSQPQLNVKVGKINGDAERALMARFQVQSYPSFFVIDGWSVYAYDDRIRDKESLIQFAQGGRGGGGSIGGGGFHEKKTRKDDKNIPSIMNNNKAKVNDDDDDGDGDDDDDEEEDNDESNDDDDDDDDYTSGYGCDPLPFYLSPLGPLGVAQGTMMSVGYGLADIFVWLQDSFHLSPLLAGMFLFGSAFVGCFFMIVFLAIAFTPREKQD